MSLVGRVLRKIWNDSVLSKMIAQGIIESVRDHWRLMRIGSLKALFALASAGVHPRVIRHV